MIDTHRKRRRMILLAAAVLILMAAALFLGSSSLSFSESVRALWGFGEDAAVRILQRIRLPRVLAAVLAGAGLSLSGCMMQTVLGNPMASPSTLGVTNAAVFGANLSLLLFSETPWLMKWSDSFAAAVSPAASGTFAFLFSFLSVLMILFLGRARRFSPGALVLCGIALGSLWNAATTIVQFYATDVGLSAGVVWSFGDLGRATYTTDLILLITVGAAYLFFRLLSWPYNALLSGDAEAASLGIRVPLLRFTTLLAASLTTAVCVSSLGIIGFVGIICPHVAKKLFGQDHRNTLPASALTGALLLLAADTISRTLGGGSALPVGAVTSLFGAPFFLFLILGERRKNDA